MNVLNEGPPNLQREVAQYFYDHYYGKDMVQVEDPVDVDKVKVVFRLLWLTLGGRTGDDVDPDHCRHHPRHPRFTFDRFRGTQAATPLLERDWLSPGLRPSKRSTGSYGRIPDGPHREGYKSGPRMEAIQGVFRVAAGNGDPTQDAVFGPGMDHLQGSGKDVHPDGALGLPGDRKTDEQFTQAHDRAMRVMYGEIGLRLP